MNFEELFQDFGKIKVAVIGDIMLDTYWWGHVERISPEAPVPVVSLDRREYRIGGAGNVALNIASLGAPVSVLSVIGNDEDGRKLQMLLEDHQVDTSALIVSDERITTNKARIISRNQQMMRLDSETTQDLSNVDESLLLQSIQRFINEQNPQVIIFEDYNKGVLTETVISRVLSICHERKILTAVDPKRKNFFSYHGVDIFKPNLKEVKEGLNLTLDHIDILSLGHIHQLLFERLGHHISFITLSERGVFYKGEENTNIIASHFRNISDVSGAGDTVIAVASLVFACTRNIQLMAEIANIAGGLVCEEVGTVAIKKEKLLSECNLLLNPPLIP